MRRDGPSDFAKDLALRLQNNEMLPDDMIIDIVSERLSKTDCRINGWILDGCPMNINQIKQLNELQFIPQLVVVFEEPDAAVIKKLSERPVDPNTGVFYDSEDSENANNQVRPDNRLCKKIVDDYREFLGQAIKAYEPHMIRINAQADAE